MLKEPKPTNQLTETCPCGNILSTILPTPEIANNLKTSVVTLSHEMLMSCSKCGTLYTLAITSCQLQVQFNQIPEELARQLAPQILVPAGGLSNKSH